MNNSISFNSRAFNHIELVPSTDDTDLTGYIIKRSIDVKKLSYEFTWLRDAYYRSSLPSSSDDVLFYPKVWDFNIYDDNSASYCISYIDFPTLSEIFLNVSDNSLLYTFHHIFTKLKENIFKQYLNYYDYIYISKYKQMVIESIYTYKTLKRLNEYGIDLDKSFIVNGIKTPTIRELVNESYVPVYEYNLRPFVHGDLCFSNILCALDPNIIKTNMYLIDPRGILEDGSYADVNDCLYDIGKLAHSCIGLYDHIMNDKGFYIDKLSDNEYVYYVYLSNLQIHIQEEFKKIFFEYESTYYDIMIHLFLSMIPLHYDRPDHQEKFLINAFRIYFMKHNIIL